MRPVLKDILLCGQDVRGCGLAVGAESFGFMVVRSGMPRIEREVYAPLRGGVGVKSMSRH